MNELYICEGCSSRVHPFLADIDCFLADIDLDSYENRPNLKVRARDRIVIKRSGSHLFRRNGSSTHSAGPGGPSMMRAATPGPAGGLLASQPSARPGSPPGPGAGLSRDRGRRRARQ